MWATDLKNTEWSVGTKNVSVLGKSRPSQRQDLSWDVGYTTPHMCPSPTA